MEVPHIRWSPCTTAGASSPNTLSVLLNGPHVHIHLYHTWNWLLYRVDFLPQCRPMSSPRKGFRLDDDVVRSHPSSLASNPALSSLFMRTTDNGPQLHTLHEHRLPTKDIPDPLCVHHLCNLLILLTSFPFGRPTTGPPVCAGREKTLPWFRNSRNRQSREVCKVR